MSLSLKPISTRTLVSLLRSSVKARQHHSALCAELEICEQKAILFDHVVATLHEHVFVISPEGRFIFANQPLLDLWDKTAEEALGKTFAELGYSEDLVQLHTQQLQTVIQTKSPLHGKNPYTNPHGKTGYYEYTFIPMFAPDGSVETICGVSEDLTEQLEADRNLQQSEERYRTLFESIDEGFCLIEMLFDAEERPVDYRFIELNPTFEKHTGLANAAGKTARELIPNLDKHWFEIYGKVALTGKGIRFENYSEPMRRWFDVYAFPVGTPENRKVAILFRDITDRKRDQDALRESESRFRHLADAMPQLVWTASPDGSVDYYNQQIREFHGAKREEDGKWVGAPMLHPDDLKPTADAWNHAVTTETIYTATHRVRMADNTYRWHLSRALPVRDSFGRVVKWFGTATDIDAQKRAAELLEERVKERTWELQEVISELEAFSYSISHDLRSPLRAMQGYASALLTDYQGKIDDDGMQYLERIHKASRRMDLLIQDVLAYSRVAKSDVELKPIYLKVLIEEILRHYPDFSLPKVDVIVKTEIPCVLGHEAYLTQCISNLIGNAAKFVAAGTIPEVRIFSEPDGQMVKVWFVDNGIGIAPEHHQQIFQIFGRVYGDKQFVGTGIGLAIVKKAIERMGGNVGVESELGKGSRFWFTLKRTV